MSSIEHYNKHHLKGAGWTRIEMLLTIYERAIHHVTELKIANDNDDGEAYANHLLNAQRAILAIHAGLKPEDDEIALNIARLLHFVTTRLEIDAFDDAIKTLKAMHEGFSAIRDEANQLELSGQIPPLVESESYQTTV